MKRSGLVLLSILVLFTGFPAWAENPHCEQVGGVLMTNIGAIKGEINLGPVFGDLQGAVAAEILGQDNAGNFHIQHYWVSSEGDTILFDQAVLHPTATDDPNVVAVLWGHYLATINGGTGKFEGAHGQIDTFGLADFNKKTLVLRYRGSVCYK